MIRPLPIQLPVDLPRARKHPDPQYVEDLFRLAAGTCHLLELIQVFDESEGWSFPGIASSATAPALL